MLKRFPPFRRRLTSLLAILLAFTLLSTLLPSTALSRPPDKMALGNSGDPIDGDKHIPDDLYTGGRIPVSLVSQILELQVVSFQVDYSLAFGILTCYGGMLTWPHPDCSNGNCSIMAQLDSRVRYE